MKSKLLVAVLSALLTISLGGIARASIPDPGTLLIHGCYTKTSGALRVVDPSKGQTCATTEAPLSWNQRGINWRGNWTSTTAYAINDAVAANGSAYVARLANTNSAPPSTNWSLLARAGATGPVGPRGATGPQGPVGPQGPPGGVSSIKAGNGLIANGSTGAVTLSVANPFAIAGSANGQAIISGGNSGAGDGIQGMTGDPGYSGVFGQNSSSGKGVFGASATGTGVDGESNSGYGVYASSAGSDAVHAVASAPGYSGIYAANTNGSGYAGYFDGNVRANGTLTVNGNVNVNGAISSSQDGAWAASNARIGIASDDVEHELTQLNLPAGIYVVMAKSLISNSDTTGGADCYLDGPSGNLDHSAADITDTAGFQTLSLEAVVSLPSLGSITYSCSTPFNGVEADDSKEIAFSVGNLH
jgi:hypothetical protein